MHLLGPTMGGEGVGISSATTGPQTDPSISGVPGLQDILLNIDQRKREKSWDYRERERERERN